MNSQGRRHNWNMFVAVMNKSYLQGHFVIGFRNVAFVMQQTEDISTLENDVDQKKTWLTK